MTAQTLILDPSLSTEFDPDYINPFCNVLLLEDRQPALPPMTAAEAAGIIRREARSRTASLLQSSEWRGEVTTWTLTVLEVAKRPSWYSGPAMLNETLELLVCGRVGRHLVLNGPRRLVDVVREWVVEGHDPRYRLVRPQVMSSALGGGDVLQLHGRGIHRPSRRKAESIALTGRALQDTMTTAHGTYTTTATRLDAEHIVGVKASVGVAPHRSSVWTGPTASLTALERFLDLVVKRIEQVDDLPHVRDLPFMARSVADLSDVARPFLMTSTPSLDLPADERSVVVEAAQLLERASFEVSPAVTPNGFRVEIALDGVDALRAVGRLSANGGAVRLSFAELQHIDPRTGPSVAKALQHKDLLTVHFGTGHTWTHDQVFAVELPDVRFDRWRWADLTRVDVRSEKPGKPYDPDLIAGPGDDSLFGWCVRTFGGRAHRSGPALPYDDAMVTCDDGAGELADFVVVDLSEQQPRVTLVHVKAAFSASPRRAIAASAFEQVLSQAQKSLVHATVGALRGRLARRPDGPTWSDGARQPGGRALMLAYLAELDAGTPVDVVVVQPHVTRSALTRALAAPADSVERLRLRHLETMLHETRAAVAARGGDFTVIADGS